MKDGFNTQDYRDGGFINIGVDPINGVFFAPGTAQTQLVREKDKIFPLSQIDLELIGDQ